MSETIDSREGKGRRERGVAANAGIFAVPANEVVVAFAERVGPLFVEEALQAAGGAAWSHPALTGRGRSIAIPPGPGRFRVSGDRLSTPPAAGTSAGTPQSNADRLVALLAGYFGYPLAFLAIETIRASVARGPGRTGRNPVLP